MSDQNKVIVRRIYEEIIGQGRLDVADELIAEDVREHNEPPGLSPGREGFKQWTAMMREIFPDLTVQVDELLGEDELVAARATGAGRTPAA